jgi:cytochrome c oxidase cbb3-type subunit 3
VGKWIGTLGLTIVLALTGQTALDAAQPQLIGQPDRSEDLIERGRQAFTVSCGFCHGIDARGGESGPDLVRSEMMLNDEGGDLLGPFLVVGRPDQGMPPQQMSDAQVVEIAAFVRAETRAVIDRQLYVIQNVVTGDAERGRAYFNGDGGCSSCHSPTGDLAGIANRFDPPRLLNRFLYPGRGGRGSQPLPQRATVTLSNGQSFAGTLEYIDDFTVAVRDATGDYRSFSRTDSEVEINNPYEAHIDLLGRYTDDDLHDLITYLVTFR